MGTIRAQGRATVSNRNAIMTGDQRAHRVLVCGGRDLTDSALVYRVLDRFHADNIIEVLIEGGARGADRIAGYWARKHRIDNLKFPADWKAHDNAAGPIRNQRMLKEGRPDVVIAFPGGHGTADMVTRAKAAGVPVIYVSNKPPQGRSLITSSEGVPTTDG